MTAVDLQQAARDHLWLHFTRMGGYRDADVPIIVRGDGCYLEDVHGKRYLDALAGLFSVNIGYSFGEEIGQAALAQMRELPFYTNWSYSHPRAIELAEEVASLAPGDLNRVFFVSGGSEAVESAWKLARQFHVARGARAREPVQGDRQARRVPRDDAGRARAHRRSRHPRRRSSRSCPRCGTSRNTNRYHRPPEETEEEFTAFLLDELEQTILDMGPETVCLVHMEPVQNAGGTFVGPAGYWQGVRELCTKYGILLSADEVITGFGRVGHWFASERYDIRPDIVCCAKGLSSSYAAIGAVVATDRVMEPFLADTSMFSHGITFGGHPVMCAIALKNIEIMKRERIVEGVLEHEAAFRSTLEQLLELPIVGDVRGTGFFYAVELVKDKETRETLLGRRVRVAAARLPLRAAVRARPHLPRRRPRRSRHPDLAAARRPPARVRPHRRGARRDAGRGVGAARPTVEPGVADPWWLQEAPPDPEQPALDGDTTADVAIVGGGFTGLWTAIELKRRDPALDVVVLEAARCGIGPSGRNGGFLHGYWSSLARFRDVLGAEGALAVARASDGAIPAVRALAHDVWLREGGLMRASTSQAQDAILDRSLAVARELGVEEEAVPLSRDELAAPLLVAGIPPRRLLPRRRHRPPGAARPRAAQRGARRGRPSARAHGGLAHRRRPRRVGRAGASERARSSSP